MGGACDLLVVANMLNELGGERTARSRRGPDLEQDARLLESWERQLAAGGRVLLVEPGMRPAAARLVRLRAAAIEAGWRPLAPCPHDQECPVPGRRGGSWCHFVADAAGMAPWVATLGRRARLPKERVSLSFQLLCRDEVERAEDAVRVVSEEFPLDGGGRGRYGCTGKGLVVLTGKGPTHSGDLLAVPRPDRTIADPRSGAPLLPLPAGPGDRRHRR
jgi:hypothetical protein